MAINFDKVPRYIRLEIDPPTKVIKSGQKNGFVKRIQEWLQYHKCRTAIDSAYGPATASCVRDFQTATGIKSTGRVDKATWNALVKPMTSALTAPAIGANDTPPETVLSVANQHVEQHPVEIGGANCGPWVRLYCEGHDGPEWAWCAGFVSLIVQQAYFYREDSSPIKGSVSCDSLASQAKKRGLFVSEKSVESGQYPWANFGGSCIFLRRRTSTDWTHTGIASVAEGKLSNLVFNTIEGNTNDEGSREGFEACRRKRSLQVSHYDFITFESAQNT